MITSRHAAWTASHPLRRVVMGTTATLLAALLLLGFAHRSHADDPETVKAYQRQFDALAADDVDGHVKLALWCRDQQAWDLLLQQCNHILTISPDNEMAKLLLELAKSKRKSPSGQPQPPADGQAPGQAKPPGQGGLGLVTDEQIQVLRRKELKLNIRENVQVQFLNDVEQRFWNYAAEREKWSRGALGDFRKLSNVEKAQFMLGYLRKYQEESFQEPFDDTFSQDIIIKRDPAVFSAFRREVWPIVEMNCATSGCHAGPDAPAISFHTGRRLTDNMLYTNFLVLTEYQQNLDWLVDRSQPLRSLLLFYAVPPETLREGEPTHPTEIRPICPQIKDRKCETLFKWIQFLGDYRPDYGFTVEDLEG